MGGISVTTATSISAQQSWLPEQSIPLSPDNIQQADALDTSTAKEVDIKSLLEQEKEKTKSLVEMMREAREKAEQQSKALQKLYKPNKSQYNEAPREAYTRLARAKNRTQVNAATGYARRRLAQLKRELRRDTDNSSTIRAAISQLQKSINRSEKKKRDLDREKLLETQRARCEREQQLKEQQRLRQELERRKTQRMIRENAYIQEANIDARLHTQTAQPSQLQLELRQQAQTITNTPLASPEAAIQQYAASAAMESTAPAPEILIES